MVYQTEKIPTECHGPLNLISLDGDYLVRIGVRDFSDEIPLERDKIIAGIKQRHGIRDDTCMNAILECLKYAISIPSDISFQFYAFIYKASERWSKSTVRKNLRKLEYSGVLQRTTIDDKIYFLYPPETRKYFKDRNFDLLGQKIAVMKVYLPDTIFRPPEEGDELHFVRTETVRDENDVKLRVGEGIINKVDLRNLSEREKRRAASEFHLLDIPKPYRYTHDQRIGIMNQVVKEAIQLPHISELYSVGSVAVNEDKEDSDMDVLVIREHCPGYDECGRRLTKADGVDLFCFTGEEFQRAHERRLAILIGASKIYDKALKT